jgi:hypothetical protein
MATYYISAETETYTRDVDAIVSSRLVGVALEPTTLKCGILTPLVPFRRVEGSGDEHNGQRQINFALLRKGKQRLSVFNGVVIGQYLDGLRFAMDGAGGCEREHGRSSSNDVR